MTFKDLSYIITVYDEGSFSEAAGKLFISQSALSQSIKKSEAEFGVELFTKSGKSSIPTQACKFFVDQGRSLVSSWQDYESRMHVFVNNLSSSFTIGITGDLCKNLMPYILPVLKVRHPDLQINLYEDHSSTLEGLVASNVMDLCLVQEKLVNTSLGNIPVFSSELMLALPRNHPFCKTHPYAGLDNPEMVSLKEFKDEPFAIMKHKRFTEYFDNIFKTEGFEPIIYRETNFWDNVKDYVSSGSAIGLIDELIVRHEPNDDKIAYYRINNKYCVRKTLAVFTSGRKLTTQENWIIEALKEYPSYTNR